MELLKGENMSFESEIMRDVKGLVENVKSTIMNNLIKVIREGKLTIEDNKLPGLDKIIRDSVDQAFANSSKTLNERLSKYSTQFKK